MPSPKNRTVDLIAVYQRHERKRLREARKIGTEYDAFFRETVGFYVDNLNAYLAGTEEKFMLDHYFGGSCQQYALLYQYRRLLGEAAPWEDLAQAGIYALAELCAAITGIKHDTYTESEPFRGLKPLMLHSLASPAHLCASQGTSG